MDVLEYNCRLKQYDDTSTVFMRARVYRCGSTNIVFMDAEKKQIDPPNGIELYSGDEVMEYEKLDYAYRWHCKVDVRMTYFNQEIFNIHFTHDDHNQFGHGQLDMNISLCTSRLEYLR